MYLLFDIGRTKMRFAFSKNGNSFETPRIVPTPKNFNDAVTIFGNAIRELAGNNKIICVAGGMTRALTDGVWYDKLVKETFSKTTNKPVFFENDSAVCGLGEAIYGAGRGHSIVAYLTVSTGVGGARIVNRKIDSSAMGFEPGYQIIDMPHSFRTDINPLGTLEGYVSGSAIQNRFGKKPKEITDQNLWEELAGELAYGVHNSIVHWSPEIVVLGGSMITGDPVISVERVKFYLKDILKIFPKMPEIKKAELEDFGGLWGALELAKQKTEKQGGLRGLFGR